MTEIFTNTGSTLFTVVLIAVELLSVIICALVLYEFHHIHRKHTELIQLLKGTRARQMRVQRHLFTTAYVVLTALILILPILLYV